MKVRLKRSSCTSTFMYCLFQFHEGPIKTGVKPSKIGFSSLFQFHEGPIKTVIKIKQNMVQLSFNSMKVRLKQALAKMVSELVKWFQFHEGPIKTSWSLRALSKVQCFNSMKVRLKQYPNYATSSGRQFQFHEGPIKTFVDHLKSVQF